MVFLRVTYSLCTLATEVWTHRFVKVIADRRLGFFVHFLLYFAMVAGVDCRFNCYDQSLIGEQGLGDYKTAREQCGVICSRPIRTMLAILYGNKLGWRHIACVETLLRCQLQYLVSICLKWHSLYPDEDTSAPSFPFYLKQLYYLTVNNIEIILGHSKNHICCLSISLLGIIKLNLLETCLRIENKLFFYSHIEKLIQC